MQHSTSPLWVITGPTGVGKTEAAMRIADHFPVDLISADSVMVYRDLNIGSAKPSKDELARYPHALVDHIDPEIPFDAGQFVSAATAAIHQSWEHQRIPVLVGARFCISVRCSTVWIAFQLRASRCVRQSVMKPGRMAGRVSMRSLKHTTQS